MVLYFFVFYANKVATKREIIVIKLHAYACSLERTATFVNFSLIIAQNGGISHFAAGMKAVGHGFKHSGASHGGKFVHIRRVGILKRGFVSE